ncbi:hypothetical protein [Nonomuraea sp. SYSU D8015]|uniref:hypothetical protein n=1 Tax=Nonomuraea sp. SYSU D8015 TaxID=2593644 RepID=UPI0016617296|nr:hypothetical protein [Nonomuraea sp. SYSU D8015]
MNERSRLCVPIEREIYRLLLERVPNNADRLPTFETINDMDEQVAHAAMNCIENYLADNGSLWHFTRRRRVREWAENTLKRFGL